jgi:DNA-binding NarL/FixJ family response regulator
MPSWSNGCSLNDGVRRSSKGRASRLALVLHLGARGEGRKEITDQLSLSRRTIEQYMQLVFEKLVPDKCTSPYSWLLPPGGRVHCERVASTS